MRISTNEFLLGGLSSLLAQENTVNLLNQEIASGQSMESATDDPAGAGVALSLANNISHLNYDATNAESGAQSIQGGLSALQEITNLVNEMRDTAVQAANGTTSVGDRQALIGTVQAGLQNLVQLANSQSADGEYLFSGSDNVAAPFVVQPNGQVIFVGDNASNSIEVGPNLSVPVTISGQGMFMNIPNATDSFTVTASGSNTGTALAVTNGVTNVGQLQAEQLAGTEFEISFGATAPNGTVAYSVTSGTGSPGTSGFAATAGVVASGSMAAGAGLSFGGVDVSFNGSPGNGDNFIVAPSQNTSIFQIFQSLVAALQAPAGSAGQKTTAGQLFENVISQLDSAQTSLLSAQATLGGNLSDIQSVQSQDSNAETIQEGNLSQLQSVNLPQVMTNYNESLVALQAAESAFARIQNLDLFSVIGP
jgi:flagellar hook-associated protein 3 FlgL